MGSIRSTRVVIGDEVRPATVVFRDGVVESISDDIPAEVDYGDHVIMPGLVDSHVHVNDPGRADWEGFPSATRAAAAGGTTTIVDMPLNSLPPTTTVEALNQKRRAAEGRVSIDVAFWGGLVPGSLADLEPLVDEGVCGFKAFMVDSGVDEFPRASADLLERGCRALADLAVPALVHAEWPDLLSMPQGDPRSYSTYLATHPPESEARAVESLARVARSTGASAHVVHVSSAMGAAAIADSAGSLTGETCPHYLIFSSEDIPDGATLFKCAPPIREREHREALWEALADGWLSMIVSDHSAAPAALKEVATGDFIRAWGGISSLQLRLPAVWDGAVRRGLGIERLVDWLSYAPAKLAGLDGQKGRIAAGADADFVIWDPDGVTEVRGASLKHRHPLTPYEGMRLRGSVVATLLRGQVVHGAGATAGAHGRMLRRR